VRDDDNKGLGKLQMKFSDRLRYADHRGNLYCFVAIDGKPFDPQTTKPPVSPPAAKVELEANGYSLDALDFGASTLTETRLPGLLRIAFGIVRRFKLTEDTWPYPTREWLETEIREHWKLYDGRDFWPEEIETLLDVILSTRARRGGRPTKEKWQPPQED
jgi:hypothetical protein